MHENIDIFVFLQTEDSKRQARTHPFHLIPVCRLLRRRDASGKLQLSPVIAQQGSQAGTTKQVHHDRGAIGHASRFLRWNAAKQNSRRSTKMAPQAADANSSAASGDAGFATETKTTSSTSGDSCTWYAGESCVQPRTGYDCLNALLSTDECAIDPNGACVSVSVYEQYLSNKAYYEPLSRYFPASNYTYCSASDAVCSTCIAEWTSNHDTTGSAGSQTYCTGSDGCVCVAAAEVPSWKQTVIEYQCGSSGDSNSVSTSQEFSSGTRICIILAMCVGAVMIFSVFAVRRCIRVASPRRSGPGSIIRPPPSGPQLSLTGWKYLREKLIETEHTFVKGDTARLDATARSAEALAEAPTVTVEVVSAPERRPSSPAPFEAQYMMAPM